MKSLCDRWILQFKLCFLLCKVLMERLRWCKICSPRLWYQWSEKIVTIFDWVPYVLKFALKFACSKLTATEIYFALHWQAIQRKVLKADCVIRQFSCRSKFLRILLRKHSAAFYSLPGEHNPFKLLFMKSISNVYFQHSSKNKKAKARSIHFWASLSLNLSLQLCFVIFLKHFTY